MKKINTLLIILLLLTNCMVGQEVKKKWEFSNFGTRIGEAGLQILDVDGDNVSEMIFGGGIFDSSVLFKAERNVSNELEYESYGFSTGILDFSCVDIDQDGIFEVIAMDIIGYLHLINGATWEGIRNYDTNLGSASAIAVVDLNGDNVFEIFVAGHSGINAYLLEDGELELLSSLPALSVEEIEIGDVDGDGKKEIVVGTSLNSSKVFNASFPFDLKFEIPLQLGKFELEDINSNGREEIIYIEDAFVKIIDGLDQSLILEINTDRDNLKGLLVQDANNDGELNIVVGTSTEILSYDLDGNGLWQMDADDPGVVNLAIGDLDSDNVNEIVWAIGTLNSGSNYGLRIGNLQNGTTDYKSHDYRITGFQIDDFDIDGQSDLVIATNGYIGINNNFLKFFDPISHNLINEIEIPDSLVRVRNLTSGYTRNSNQKELIWNSNFKVVVFDPISNEVIFVSDPSNSLIETLILGDTNNDGIEEILIGKDNGDLVVLKYNDNEYEEILNQNLNPLFRIEKLALGDYDQDNELELIFFSEQTISSYDFPELELNWEIEDFFSFYNDFFITDLNADGVKEVMVLGVNPSFYHIDAANGEILDQFENPFLAGPVISELATANLDSSPEDEIIVGYANHPFILNKDMTELIAEFYVPERQFNSILINDVDNNGIPDIFFRGERGIHQHEGDFISSIKIEEHFDLLTKVYPNPVTEVLSIEIPSKDLINDSVLRIYDNQGKLLDAQTVSMIPEEINVGTYPSGFYYLILSQHGKILRTEKFLKF